MTTDKNKLMAVMLAADMIDKISARAKVAPEEIMIELVNFWNKAADERAKEKGLPGLPLGHQNTGNSERGRLNKDDKGGTLSIIEKRSDGIVYIDMGRVCISWIAMTPDQAKLTAKQLVEAANSPTPKPELRPV